MTDRTRRCLKWYSPQEMKLIDSMYLAGYPYKEIAKRLNRNVLSVIRKIERMGYKVDYLQRTNPFAYIDCLEAIWGDNLKMKKNNYILKGEVISREDLATKTNQVLMKGGLYRFEFPNHYYE